MALPNAYAQYDNNRVMTASPAELTLMLYEGMIKFCNRAIDGARDKDVQKTHDNIRKVKNIIMHLRGTLDFKYEVAKDFEQIYMFLLGKLSDANISKDPDDLEAINVQLRTLRDTWKTVMEKNRKGEV